MQKCRHVEKDLNFRHKNRSKIRELVFELHHFEINQEKLGVLLRLTFSLYSKITKSMAIDRPVNHPIRYYCFFNEPYRKINIQYKLVHEYAN